MMKEIRLLELKELLVALRSTINQFMAAEAHGGSQMQNGNNNIKRFKIGTKEEICIIAMVQTRIKKLEQITTMFTVHNTSLAAVAKL